MHCCFITFLLTTFFSFIFSLRRTFPRISFTKNNSPANDVTFRSFIMWTLFVKTEALTTNWTKFFCQYQKENKILTMIPYNQATGKGISGVCFLIYWLPQSAKIDFWFGLILRYYFDNCRKLSEPFGISFSRNSFHGLMKAKSNHRM